MTQVSSPGRNKAQTWIMCGNYTYFAEGCGMLFRSTKGAMRLHRSGFEAYPEILRYTEG